MTEDQRPEVERLRSQVERLESDPMTDDTKVTPDQESNDYRAGHSWMCEDEDRAIIHIPEGYDEGTVTCIGKVCDAFVAGCAHQRASMLAGPDDEAAARERRHRPDIEGLRGLTRDPGPLTAALRLLIARVCDYAITETKLLREEVDDAQRVLEDDALWGAVGDATGKWTLADAVGHELAALTARAAEAEADARLRREEVERLRGELGLATRRAEGRPCEECGADAHEKCLSHERFVGCPTCGCVCDTGKPADTPTTSPEMPTRPLPPHHMWRACVRDMKSCVDIVVGGHSLLLMDADGSALFAKVEAVLAALREAGALPGEDTPE